MCTVLLPPIVNPTAVNKYINSRQHVTPPNIGTCCYTPAIIVCVLKIDVLHSDMAYHRRRISSNTPRCLDLLCRIHQRLFLYTCICRLHTDKSRLEPTRIYEIIYYVRSGLGRCPPCEYVEYTNITTGQGRPDTRTVYCSVLVESI